LEVTYTAPSTPGEDTITLTVSDPTPNSNQVSAEFPITVVSAPGDTTESSQITILIGPAAIGMNFLRQADALKVTLVTVPTTGLAHAWSGTGDFAGLSSTDNPMVISGFQSTWEGTVTATVTDDNGLTASLTHTITSGDFPYTIQPPASDTPPYEGMVLITGGSFQMGDLNGGGDSDELPVHTVTVGDFYISDHEVTASEYKACVDDGGCSYNGGTSIYYTYGASGKENHLLNYVSWDETQDFITWLNSGQADWTYRLCMKSEWEYAARAGTTTKWSCGNDESCLDDVACPRSPIASCTRSSTRTIPKPKWWRNRHSWPLKGLIRMALKTSPQQ
jgi:formylglycine-generating enzyme required for sulfatase activity